MRPVLFRWRGRAVSSYVALLYAGLVAGLAVGNAVARANHLPSGRVYAATVILLAPALLGARLAYVVAHRSMFGADPGSVFRRSAGGQAMLGGLVAVPASIPLLAALGVGFWAFWDVATFTMLTGMVFARAGCLLTGCCAGRRTESRLALVLADHRGERARRVPTQIFEGLTALVLIALASAVDASEAAAGSVFLVVLGAYGAVRMVLQGLREERPKLAGISMQRVASASLVALAVSSVSLRGL